MALFKNNDDKEGVEATPSEWLQQTMDTAIRANASDIHIEPTALNVVVRARIDGILRVVDQLDVSYLSPIISCLKVMSGLNIAESRHPQDGHIVFNLQNGTQAQSIDVRLSIFPTIYGEAGVLRIQNRTDLIFDNPEKLGISQLDLERLQFVLQQSEGMVLVTGPGGSGKTTTLYTILNSMQTSQRNIVTLEDPVELELKGVRQSQIHPEIGYDFAQGLRSILRQDANIVMVGEIRDNETAEISIRAALTGILFFSTIHTTNSIGAIVRFIELGIPRSLVASALRVVIAQRLVRNICPACRQQSSPSERIMEFCGIPREYTGNFYAGKGCDKCFGTGYSGRRGIYEVLFVTEEMQRLIIEGSPINLIEAEAKRNGLKTLRELALDLALQGQISLDEVIRMTPLH